MLWFGNFLSIGYIVTTIACANPPCMKKILLLLTGLAGMLCARAGRVDTNYAHRLLHAANDSQRLVTYIDAMRHFVRSNNDSYLHYADLGLTYFGNNNYKPGEARIVEQMSITDQSFGRTLMAKKRTEHALNIYRELNDTPGMARLTGDMGAVLASRGEYDEALKYLIESLRLGGDEDSEILIAGYMNIAAIYMQMNDTLNATTYLNKATAAVKGDVLNEKIIGLYNMVGVLHALKGQPEKALEIFLNNLEMSDDKGLRAGHVECLSYLGQFYLEAGDVSKAESYLKQGLELATRYQLTEMRSNILEALAAGVQEQDPKAAIAYLKEALQIASEMGNKSFMVTVYVQLADVYKQIKDYKEALAITELKQKLTDSLFRSNKLAEVSGLMAEYELERSHSRIKDLELNNSKRTAQRNMLIGIVIGVAILCVVLVFFTRRMVVLNSRLKAHEASLQELNDMKDKLFSIIAHDMRGPVARIPALLDIFEDEDTGEDERTFLLENLRTHTQDLIEMLEKLLLWGQSLMKGTIIQQQRVAVKPSVQQDMNLKKLALAEKNINVIDNTADGQEVMCDPTHFDFIVRNLLTNAIKYSHNGGTITVGSDSTGKPGYVVISVKDTGVGIAPDMLPRIFNPIRSTPGTADEKGTGIGLVLCREFAEMNGGEIWVESKEGEGATFSVAFKAA